MNCIWILLLLCCCGHGNNSCVSAGDNCNNVGGSCDCHNDCNEVRERREDCERNSCDKNSCERDSRERISCERNERECSCEDNYSARTERIVPPLRSDYSTYGRNDRRDDNDYNRHSDDYDRRDRRCETCGCEADQVLTEQKRDTMSKKVTKNRKFVHNKSRRYQVLRLFHMD